MGQSFLLLRTSFIQSVLKIPDIGGKGTQRKFTLFTNGSAYGFTLAAIILLGVVNIMVTPVESYNDEKGILKWNPYWFSNFRYSAPSSYYISPNRIGTPFKRTSNSDSSSGGVNKWSPVFFSSGGNMFGSSPFHTSAWYGGGGEGSSYMFGSSRPRWLPVSSYTGDGRSRFLTKYYPDSSMPTIPRSSILDLGSNDLSALLGDEMNPGLGLENDQAGILDDIQAETPQQE